MNSQTRQSDSWLSEITVLQLETEPDPVFARLRQEAPLAWIPAIGGWMASTWDMCTRIADDPDHFAGGHSPLLERVIGRPNVLGAEGEMHRRLRAATDPDLKPRAFGASLEERIRPYARRQAEQLHGRRSVELMAELFEPISVRACGDVMGYDHVDVETLRRWFHGLASGMANVDLVEADFQAADAVKAEIDQVSSEMAASAAATTTGIVTRWLGGSRSLEGDQDLLEELYPTLYVVLLGGLQEPGHACGSTLYGLSTQPEQLARVAGDPRREVAKAVAEGLRWIAPIFAGTTRIALKDTVVDGHEITAGQTVWMGYGSANRDESRFDNADVFDLDRIGRRQLAFGFGRHACAGAAFGTQVARIGLEELFRVAPRIQLDPDHPVEVWGWVFRGVRELHAVL